MRTSVYVDGFNLYYGALKRTNCKWLNPVELARRSLLRECLADGLPCFTDWASGIPDKNLPTYLQSDVNALGAPPDRRPRDDSS